MNHKKKKRYEIVQFNIALPSESREEYNFQLEKIFYDTINRLSIETCGLKQMLAVKELQKHINQQTFTDSFDSNLMDVLSDMYFSISSKFPLKKKFNSLYKILWESNKNNVLSSLQHILKRLVQSPSSDPPPNSTSLVIDAITNLLSSLPFGNQVLTESFSEIVNCLSHFMKTLLLLLRQEHCVSRKSLLYTECQSTLKCFTLLLQSFEDVCKTSAENDTLHAASQGMLTSIIELLKDEHVPVNCGLNAGIAYTMVLRCAKKVDILSYCSSCYSNNKFDSLPTISHFLPISQAYIWNGILATTSGSALLVQKNAFLWILKEIMTLSQNSKNSEVILLCSKATLQWTNRCLEMVCTSSYPEQLHSEFSDEGFTVNTLIQYILSNQEHSIDGLKYSNVQILANIIKLHMKSSDIDSTSNNLMKKLCTDLLNMPTHCRGKYCLLSCLAEHMGAMMMVEMYETLPKDLYEALNEASLASHVCEFLDSLYKKSFHEMSSAMFQKTWLDPLCQCLHDGSKEQVIAILQYVLPVLLQTNIKSSEYLISELSKHGSLESGGSLAALLACAKFVHAKSSSTECKGTFMPIPLELYKKALCHIDDQVRLSAFSGICDCRKSTEPLLIAEFELIKYAIPWNISCQCPSFRQQFISHMKKFLVRMKESYYALSRKSKDLLGTAAQKHSYEEFLMWFEEHLISNFHPGANFPKRVTSLNLLSLLHSIFQSSTNIGPNCLQLPSKNASLAYSLLEMLKDTYENNKLVILEMLTSSNNILTFETDSDMMSNLFSDAMAMLSSTKPPDAVTASYLFAFLVKLESTVSVSEAFLNDVSTSNSEKAPPTPSCLQKELILIQVLKKVLRSQLRVAEKSLLRAAAEGPLYGVLTSIRRLIMQTDFSSINTAHSVSQWQKEFEELINLCLNVASVVQSVVCNASPEGHLPMDTDPESIEQLQRAIQNALGCRFQNSVIDKEENDDAFCLDLVKSHAVTAQMLLLCSWRTHKEVSLLFGEIATKVPTSTQESNTGILNSEQLLNIGHYFTTQLSQVKHRGAFEQAYVGFHELCRRLWRSPVPMLQELPKKWLQELFDVILGKIDTMLLCSSRRSAGLPYMMQALLITEPDILGSPSFTMAMKTLLNMTMSPDLNLDSQVHALNILRALYRDSCLGEGVMPFVSDGLKVAILGFKAQKWTVRNSSTLLFSALITRIFGVNRSRDEPQRKNCLTGRVFFSRFPNLYEFLLEELKLSVSKLRSTSDKSLPLEPSLYPVLLVLGRLYPSPLEGNDSSMKLSAFIPLLLQCAESPIYKIRVLAAKALFPLLSSSDQSKVLEDLFSSLLLAFNRASHNMIHGILLQILQIMKELHHGRLINIKIDATKICNLINSCESIGLRENPCYISKGTFIEVLNYYILLWPEGDDGSFCNVMQYIVDECKNPSIAIGKEVYLVHGVYFLFSCLLQRPHDTSLSFCGSKTGSHELTIKGIILDLLSSTFYEVRLATLKCLLFMTERQGEPTPVEISDCDIIFSFLKRSNSNQKYLDFEVAEMLVNLATLREKHHTCLQMLYHLMCKLPTAIRKPWDITLGQKHLHEKLDFLLSELQTENREALANAMLLFSGHVALELYRNISTEERCGDEAGESAAITVLSTWCSRVEAYAHPDSGIESRQFSLLLLNCIKESLLCDKFNLLGKSIIPLWNSLLLLLTDDEPEIKNDAAKIIKALKTFSNIESSSSSFVVPTLALDHFIGLFIRQFFVVCPDDCISTLLKWMLCNSTDESFQTDEQPFDKGEMNVFSEDFTLMSLTHKHLSQLPSTDLNLAARTIELEGKASEEGSIKTSYRITDFIGLCIAEMHSFVETFNYSPFQNRHFEKHLLYISQRVYVISCFTPHIGLSPHHKEQLNTSIQIIKDIPHKNAFLFKFQTALEECVA